MKRITYTLLAVLILAIMSITFATPVFADDPPGVDVSIGIVTPGNVDLDVGVDAGGNVNVTVDGVDLQQTASIAWNAYNKAFEPQNTMADYSYYWKLTGIGPMVEGRLAALEGLSSLLMTAQAKLIQGYTLTNEEVTSINTNLDTLKMSTTGFSASVDAAISKLETQDEVTWNQLMYGAEYHLSLLQDTVDEQTKVITSLQDQLNSANAAINASDEKNTALAANVEYLRIQGVRYLLIGGSCIIVLLGLTIWSLARKH